MIERGPGEFVLLAKSLMKTHGDFTAAAYSVAETHPHQSRVAEVCKAAVGAGSLSNPEWAGNLAPYSQVSNGFLESLRSLSVFDRMLGDNAIQRVPLRTKLTVVTGSSVGTEVDEMLQVPVGKMTLTGQSVEPLKVLSLVVLNQEVILNTSNAAMSMLSRELRNAVASATDSTFLTRLLAGVTPITPSGASAANVLADIGTLLEAVAPRAGSKLYLVIDPVIAMRLSVMTAFDDKAAFPNLTYAGGEVVGIPVLVTDQITPGTVALIDAAGIAGESDLITMDASDEASIIMDDDPEAVEPAGATLVSLWQSNQRAIRCVRYFGFQKVRPHPVAVLSGVAYK